MTIKFFQIQAALPVLSCNILTSTLVWECYFNLQKLVMKNKITLIWTLDNAGLSENEEADKLGKPKS